MIFKVMGWTETLKNIGLTSASVSHTTNSDGEPPPFEHIDRTKAIYVSYGDMKVIWRNGKNKKI